MKLKIKEAQKRNKDSGGKKRPFQDDSAIILAATVLMIVAQVYVVSIFQPAKPQKIIIVPQTDDVATSVNQNLSGQRQSIEEHIKRFLFIPGDRSDNSVLVARRPSFSELGWAGYQVYLAEQQATIPAGERLNAEFVFGSQKYAVLGDEITAFRADGVFCLGVDQNYRCGPRRFVVELLLRGSIDTPEALGFDSWKVMPQQAVVPAAAPPTTPPSAPFQ